MAAERTTPVSAPVPVHMIEIERIVAQITYLTGRARQHDRLMATAGLMLDRAAVAILRNIAGSEPVRPGVLAVRLSVEASHVTRQLRGLERDGYVIRVADPDDRRAQRVQLTERGIEAVERIRDASRQGVGVALADWAAEDLAELAGLLRRMAADFVTHAEDPMPVR
ncbi:MarR family winged helix-turn-helix transcriptional regulator [Streptomyces sp. NPDC087212]|uniref:MarR family winged helix-turn-helix transcriptional regulator n=1 Tax=Streptomyces sp. NPDC087212 TaxID=3365766 RepID=UPI0038095884